MKELLNGWLEKMFKVCGNTNYECSCAEEQVFGNNLDIIDAFNLFLRLLEEKDSLDFTEMDAAVDDWAESGDWNEEDYYWGSYGGTIAVYEESNENNYFDREQLFSKNILKSSAGANNRRQNGAVGASNNKINVAVGANN